MQVYPDETSRRLFSVLDGRSAFKVVLRKSRLSTKKRTAASAWTFTLTFPSFLTSSSSAMSFSKESLEVLSCTPDQEQLADPFVRFAVSIEHSFDLDLEHFVEKKVDFAMMYEVV